MAAPQLILVDELVTLLESRNLIIVPKNEFIEQAELRRLQTQLLRKKALTIQEIVNGKLLKVTTRQSVKNWIDNGTIRATENFPNSKGVQMILTIAVKRLREL